MLILSGRLGGVGIRGPLGVGRCPGSVNRTGRIIGPTGPGS